MMTYRSEEKCNKCGSYLTFTETQTYSVHYGRLDCPKCVKWIKWVKSPEKERIRTKTSKRTIEEIIEFHNYKIPFCFFCLRKQEQLGKKETLTIDHIDELSKSKNDEIENLQILCSACHKLKNWARLYINWHYKNDT